MRAAFGRPSPSYDAAGEASFRNAVEQAFAGSASIASVNRLKSFVKADLPDPLMSLGLLIYVSDETGGAVPAFSDGANWRRITDRAVVS